VLALPWPLGLIMPTVPIWQGGCSQCHPHPNFFTARRVVLIMISLGFT